MKRSKLRQSGIRSGIITHHVDIENEHITFRGKFPGVMAIPNIMRSHPGYTHSIIRWDEFNERFNVKDA